MGMNTSALGEMEVTPVQKAGTVRPVSSFNQPTVTGGDGHCKSRERNPFGAEALRTHASPGDLQFSVGLG